MRRSWKNPVVLAAIVGVVGSIITALIAKIGDININIPWFHQDPQIISFQRLGHSPTPQQREEVDRLFPLADINEASQLNLSGYQIIGTYETNFAFFFKPGLIYALDPLSINLSVNKRQNALHFEAMLQFQGVTIPPAIPPPQSLPVVIDTILTNQFKGIEFLNAPFVPHFFFKTLNTNIESPKFLLGYSFTPINPPDGYITN